MEWLHLAKHTWPLHRRFWQMIVRWWLIVDTFLNPFKKIVLLIPCNTIINGKHLWYTVTFNTWLPDVCTCIMIWPSKLFPAPYYIWRYALILFWQVSSDASTLKQNLLYLSLPWDQKFYTGVNVHRNKYFTGLILVVINKYEKFPWYRYIRKSIC